MAKAKKAPKAKAAKKPSHKFRTAAEADAWADSMQAQVKAGNRPTDAATLGQIESARQVAKDLRAAGS